MAHDDSLRNGHGNSPDGVPAVGSSSGSGGDSSLPPVEVPNVRMIIQLFVVPSILVVVVMGFILVFFGGIGAGPRTPDQFIDGLNSPSGHKRQQTAHDLAQVLPRSAELRHDVKFSLDVTDMLAREIQTQAAGGGAVPPATPGDELNLLDYLPAVVGNFSIPAGAPLLRELVRTQIDGRDQALVRARNAILALGNMGHRLREFDSLPPAERDQILAALKVQSGSATDRQRRAQEALDYLTQRQDRRPGVPVPDTLGIVPTLRLGARVNDELTRKYTIMALANWDAPGVDELLREMVNVGSDLTQFENADSERGRREIRYNAALALARRASPLTPDSLVLETLDEQLLARLYPDPARSPAIDLVLKSLRDLGEFKNKAPDAFAEKTEIIAGVQKLGSSPTMAIQIEARRLLEGRIPAQVAPGYFSRQLLLMTGVALGVLFFLGLAVFARWRRSTPATATSTAA
ncbi:MAG TPA: hypothetical protein PKD86_02600 [Gemmatales bacterium]|nr:hypothetical protein [Gemmatales bacterium]